MNFRNILNQKTVITNRKINSANIFNRQIIAIALIGATLSTDVNAQEFRVNPGISQNLIYDLSPNQEFLVGLRNYLSYKRGFGELPAITMVPFPAILSLDPRKLEMTQVLQGLKITLENLSTSQPTPWVQSSASFRRFLELCPYDGAIPYTLRTQLIDLFNQGFNALTPDKKAQFGNSLWVNIPLADVDETSSSALSNWFQNLRTLGTSTNELGSSYKNLMFQIVSEVTSQGIPLPLNATGWTKMNTDRLHREMVLYGISSLQERNLLINQIPADFISARNLELKIEPNGLKLIKRSNVMDITGISFLLVHNKLKAENLPQEIRAQKPINVKDLPEYGKVYRGEYHVTDWVYGKFDNAYTWAVHPFNQSALLNIMKAFPETNFLTDFRPLQSLAYQGITDFPAFFNSLINRDYLNNNMQYREETVPGNPLESGYPWTRDSILQGENNVVFSADTGNPQLDPVRLTPASKPIVIKPVIDGGGMFPVGRRFFVNRLVLNDYVVEKENHIKVNFSFNHHQKTYNVSNPIKLPYGFSPDNWDTLLEFQKDIFLSSLSLSYVHIVFPNQFQNNTCYFNQECIEIMNSIKEALRIELDSGRFETGYKIDDETLGTREEVIKDFKLQFQKLFGRELVVVGEELSTPPSFRHLDVYTIFLPTANTGDKPTVLVASAKLASDLLSPLSTSQMREIEYRQARVAHRQISAPHDYIIQLNGEPKSIVRVKSEPKGNPWINSIRAPLNNDPMLNGISYDEEEAKLDAEAQWWKSKGYQVYRFPKIFVGNDGRFFYPYERNYANGFVETKPDGVYFTMNRYGITPLEDYMVNLLTGLGVHVRFLDGMLSASGDAGPHCYTNENREPIWWK